MERSILRQILIDQQTGLRSSEGLVERDIDLDRYINGNEIIVISGVRRSGKSSLLKLISRRISNKCVWINFDDIRFSDFETKNFTDIEEMVSELFDPDIVYLLDEVQNVENWSRWVNNLHGKGKKVFVTGSNSRLLSSEISTYLTGRNRKIHLTTFGFNEMLKLMGKKIEDVNRLTSEERGSILGHFNRYMELGGFPDVLKENDVSLSREYFEDIITKDIIVRYGIREVREFKDLSLFIISNSGSNLSYSTLRDISGVKSVSTIKSYIDHLEEAYLVKKVDCFSYSLKKQRAIPSKIYATDIGFLKSVSFNFMEKKGKTLENLVFNHLTRKQKEVYFHLGKKECDFLVRDGYRITEAIQVSYSLSNKKTKEREISGLVEAMKTYDLKSGTIISFEEEDELEVDGYLIEVIPAWKWILLN